ncbi:MAG: aminoglycoside phosphotransferase family protein [Candidatus Saccharimonadales bacterium]
MNNSERLKFLSSEGVIPLDSRIISTHNNLVVASDSESIVARISTVAQIEARKDPGDLIYSHKMSNVIGRDGAVLSPIDERPIEFGENIISRYPKMPIPDWSEVSGDELAEAARKLNSFPYQTAGLFRNNRIRHMNVADYVQSRLKSLDDQPNKNAVTYIQKILDKYRTDHCFSTAAIQSGGLVHGDMHSGNVVSANNQLLFIDLDSIAIGPREYDLASWCVRRMRGDVAPAVEATTLSVAEGLVNKDLIRSMVGWKVLSSMSHELVYNPINSESKIIELARIAEELEAPGDWSSNA